MQCEHTVGIPNGRFSSLPGFGIHTRRVGFDSPVSLSSPASSRRAAGGKLFSPSTPAVFLPWFSTVTRRTANTLLDHDLISVLWSLRTCLTSPRREAAYMRFCSFQTYLSALRQLIVFQSSVIVIESEARHINCYSYLFAFTHCGSRLLILAVKPSFLWHYSSIRVRHLLLEPSFPLIAYGLTAYLLPISGAYKRFTSFLISMFTSPLGRVSPPGV